MGTLQFNMVLSLSLLAITLLAVAASADSAAQPANHEWPEQVYGNTINGREKRQMAEGGKPGTNRTVVLC